MTRFFATLSAEQRVLFGQGLPSLQSMSPGEFQVAPMRDVRSVLLPADGPAYLGKKAAATESEVVVLATLLTVQLDDHRAVQKWQEDVARAAPNQQYLSGIWVPIENSMVFHPKGDVVRELAKALEVNSGDGKVEAVAEAMAGWRGTGATNAWTPATIDTYVRQIRKPRKDRRVCGPAYDTKGNASSRHVSAIPRIAAVLAEHGPRIRHLLGRSKATPAFDPNETKAELHERLEERLKAVENEKSMLEVENITLKNGVRLAKQAASKSQIAHKATKATMLGHTKRVRDEMKAGLKASMPAIREAADEELKAKAIRKQELLTMAHAEKRAAKGRQATAEHLAVVRLKEAKDLKRQRDELAAELDEAHDKMDTGETAKAHADAYEKLKSMPSWAPTRGAGNGRGRALFTFDYRVTIYSFFANGTPLSAIGRNITRVVKHTAAWLSPKAPSRRMLSDCRFELRMIEECLAARRVACAFAIRMLGFDETTKNGNPSITSNVIIEPTKGAPLEPVILRGAYCSAGGTSDAIAGAIESKCFARLRDFLRRWKAKFIEMYPTEKWTGPEAADLSMGRLAGRGAIQSDTCNTAEKAKTILTEMIAKQARVQIGEEAWAKLSEQEQLDVTRVHKLDCWQHLRNIFLKEMSTAQSRHVAEELKPHLDAFSSWDRFALPPTHTQLYLAPQPCSP